MAVQMTRKEFTALVSKAFPIGQEVELVHTDDPYTLLQPGARGTVTYIDSMGTVFVKWENGSNLGMVIEAGDRIVPIASNERKGQNNGAST